MSDFNYGTGDVVGSDIFDTTTTGASFYNDLLPGSGEEEYMADAKNLKGEIKMVSPYEYFQGCADIFSSGNKKVTAKQQIDFIRNYEQDKIDELKDVILKKKKKFPLTYLNYAELGQEGRHRMYVAGELFGWYKKFPCLIVNWADEDRHNRQEENSRQYEVESKIDDAIGETKRYRFSNLEECAEELEWQLDLINEGDRLDEKIVYSIDIVGNKIIATITDEHNVKYTKEIRQDELRIEPTDDSDDLGDNILLDDDELKSILDNMIKDY